MNRLLSRLFPTACLVTTVLFHGLSVRADDANPNTNPPLPPSGVLIQVLATDPIALAGSSSGAFTIVRAGAIDTDLTVHFSLSGSGTNGVDYVVDGKPLGTSVVIPAHSAAGDIVIDALINPANRGNKTVRLTLETNASYVVGKHDKATVRLIDDTFGDLAPKVSLTATGGTAGANGVPTFTLPATVGLVADATDADDGVAKVSFYDGDDLIGSASAPDATGKFVYNWVNPRPGTHSLFARAVDKLGKSTLSSAVDIVVNGQLPKIALGSLVAPAPGGNLELLATVTPGSGAVTKVEFAADGKTLGAGTATAADPNKYSFTWTGVTVGTHVVTATVTDSLGFTAKSVGSFKVTAPANQAPVVKIEAPATDSTFPATATIQLTADATDADGTINRVAFYADGRVVGIVRTADAGTTSKYSFAWVKPAAGRYIVRAHATDNLGRQTWSPSIVVTVTK